MLSPGMVLLNDMPIAIMLIINTIKGEAGCLLPFIVLASRVGVYITIFISLIRRFAPAYFSIMKST